MRTRPLSNALASAVTLLLLLAGAVAGAESAKLLKDTPFEEIVAKAKAGNPDCQIYMAKSYQLGSGGVPRDRKESHRWFVAAATNNVMEALFYMGDHFYNEASTIKGMSAPDKAKRQQAGTAALNWYMKAAKRGSVDAYANLGAGFEAGNVYAKDLVEAYKWFHLAVETDDHRYARARLVSSRNSLSLRLNPAQIDEAKRRALMFLETHAQETNPRATQ